MVGDAQIIHTVLHQILTDIFCQVSQGHCSSLRHLPPDVEDMLLFRNDEICDPIFGDLLNLVSHELPHINLLLFLLSQVKTGLFLDLSYFGTGLINSLLLSTFVLDFQCLRILLILTQLQILVSPPRVKSISTRFVLHPQKYGLSDRGFGLTHVFLVGFPNLESIAQNIELKSGDCLFDGLIAQRFRASDQLFFFSLLLEE